MKPFRRESRDQATFSHVFTSESLGIHCLEEMFAGITPPPGPMERDSDGEGARAWALRAEVSCPHLAHWTGWGPNEGGQMRTQPREGQKASWECGAVEPCPSQAEEQGASPMGLLGTESLSGMNVPLCKVLACPRAGFEGPWTSLPLRGGITGAQSQCQVGFWELQSLWVLSSGIRRCEEPSTLAHKSLWLW